MFNVRRSIPNPSDYEDTVDVGPSKDNLFRMWGHLSVNNLQDISSKVQAIYKDPKQMSVFTKDYEENKLDSIKFDTIDNCIRWCIFVSIQEQREFIESKKRSDEFWSSLERLEYEGILVNDIVKTNRGGCEHKWIVSGMNSLKNILNSKEWYVSPKEFMQKRLKERGYTEEYRIPDDMVTSVLGTLLRQISRPNKKRAL